MSKSKITDSSVRWTVTTGDLTTQFVGVRGACEEIAALHQEIERLRQENATLQDRLQRRERMEICEHDVPDGDWCQPCNAEEKRAREEPAR